MARRPRGWIRSLAGSTLVGWRAARRGLSTRGACSAAVLYRRSDWQQFLERTPASLIVRDGFDLTFVWKFAPGHRAGAVSISLSPSAVYHAGFHGVHVCDADLNCDFSEPLDDVIVQ